MIIRHLKIADRRYLSHRINNALVLAVCYALYMVEELPVNQSSNIRGMGIGKE